MTRRQSARSKAADVCGCSGTAALFFAFFLKTVIYLTLNSRFCVLSKIAIVIGSASTFLQCVARARAKRILRCGASNSIANSRPAMIRVISEKGYIEKFFVCKLRCARFGNEAWFWCPMPLSEAAFEEPRTVFLIRTPLYAICNQELTIPLRCYSNLPRITPSTLE